LVFAISPSSHRVEPPRFPERFNPRGGRDPQRPCGHR
jgi:hypothetical protein